MPKAMCRHILVKTEAEAAQLKKRLAKGEAFDVLDERDDVSVVVLRGAGRAFVDMRLMSIGGGSDETMMHYLAKQLGF